MTARTLLRAASAVVDRLAPRPGITMLIYHRVEGGTTSAVDLDRASFSEQLATLRVRHRVITLDDAVVELTSPGDPSPGVVVTIDDGTRDVTDVIVPLLVEHQVPAILYVATRFVDEGVDFPWGSSPTSWAALRDAVSTGLVSIGSHTHTHPEMRRMDAATAAAELDRSIGLVEDRLGLRPVHFAYPRAVAPSPAAEVEVRRRFTTAALAGSRANRAGTDVHRLTRTPVQRMDDDRFDALASGGGRFEGGVRATVLATRRRLGR